MKLSTKTTVVAGTVAAGLIALAPGASANTFSGSINAGGYAYNDGNDRFCVVADNGKTITATLTPDSTSRGPKRTVSASNGGSSCTSLATAYEDTHYTARISGTSSTTKTVGFYS